MKLLVIVLGAAAGLLVGCGSSSPTAARVPDVKEQPLDAAEDALDAKGLPACQFSARST